MGMTIDKTIEFFNGLECHTPQAKDARDVAMETMRKYQKIQEIVQHWIDADLASESPSFADTNTIEDIIEVIKDE